MMMIQKMMERSCMKMVVLSLLKIGGVLVSSILYAFLKARYIF